MTSAASAATFAGFVPGNTDLAQYDVTGGSAAE
jgi:hypothetical protein